MSFILPKKRQTIARNAQLPTRASQTIDAVTSIIQQQNHNAIQAKGYPIAIYKRLTAGKPCSCSHHEIENDAYTDEGIASEAQLDSIVNASRFSVSISGYGSSDSNSRFATDLNEAIDYDEEGEIDIPATPFADKFSAGACPICLGTGIIGGYSCLEYNRLVLTFSDAVSNGVTVAESKYPIEMELSLPESYVDFTVTLPMQVPNTKVNLRVMDGFTQVHGKVLVSNNGTWSEFNGNVPLGKVTFRILGSNFTPLTSFTHLEIQMPNTSRETFADIPNLIRAYDPLKVYPYAPTTFSLSPEIPALSAWDVIADVNNKLLWMVTSARPVYAANMQIWHQDVEVRCIEPYEPQHSLLIPNGVLQVQNGSPNYFRQGGY